MAIQHERTFQISTPLNFPQGLQVLAVDGNGVCLKVLVRMLEACCYNVIPARSPMEALEKIRENKVIFDIMITNVKNLEMNGFELLDTVVIETDLPVIMISADESKRSVMKSIRHGAQDYMLKPIRIETIKNIWQHVFRIRKSLTQTNNSSSITQTKNKRLIWSVELHNKFVDAIEILGISTTPKQIMRIMNEPGVTRANISSHLQTPLYTSQKFRNMLSGKSKAGSHTWCGRLPHFKNTSGMKHMNITDNAVHGNALMQQLLSAMQSRQPFALQENNLPQLNSVSMPVQNFAIDLEPKQTMVMEGSRLMDPLQRYPFGNSVNNSRGISETDGGFNCITYSSDYLTSYP